LTIPEGFYTTEIQKKIWTSRGIAEELEIPGASHLMGFTELIRITAMSSPIRMQDNETPTLMVRINRGNSQS
jgi:hypothetical protein